MTTWHSGCPNNAACIEVAADEFGHILVRNSADPADYLAFTRAEFVGCPWMVSCCSEPCQATSHPPRSATTGAGSFAAHFKDRKDVAMTTGKAGDPIDAEALKLVEVPAVLSGVDKAGTPFRVEGPILLRVTDKSATPDAPPHWQIVRTPFPA